MKSVLNVLSSRWSLLSDILLSPWYLLKKTLYLLILLFLLLQLLFKYLVMMA